MRGLVELKDFVLWGDAVKLDNGVWMRLSLADWKQLNLHLGDQLAVRVAETPTLCLQVAELEVLTRHVLVTLRDRVPGGST